MTVMVDTGAAVSLMGSKALKQLAGSKVKLDPTPVTFCLADKTKSIPEGSVCLPFTLHGIELQHPFLILKDLIYDVILGSDFLLKYGAKLDYVDQTLCLRTEGNEKRSKDVPLKLKLVEPITGPARSEITAVCYVGHDTTQNGNSRATFWDRAISKHHDGSLS